MPAEVDNDTGTFYRTPLQYNISFRNFDHPVGLFVRITSPLSIVRKLGENFLNLVAVFSLNLMFILKSCK